MNPFSWRCRKKSWVVLQRANIVDVRMLPGLWSNVTDTVTLTNLNLLFWCCKVPCWDICVWQWWQSQRRTPLRCRHWTYQKTSFWLTRQLLGRYLKLSLIFTSPTYWNSRTVFVSYISQANEELVGEEEVPTPHCLVDASGQLHKFRVKVIPWNFTSKRQTIIVTKVFCPALLPPRKTTVDNPS